MVQKIIPILCLLWCMPLVGFGQQDKTATIQFVNQVLGEEEHWAAFGVRLADYVQEGQEMRIILKAHEAFALALNADLHDELYEHLLPLLPSESGLNYRIGLMKGTQFIPLEQWLSVADAPKPAADSSGAVDAAFATKGDAAELTTFFTARQSIKRRVGALREKTVWLSPGHGWLYQDNQWITQRKNSDGLVEDFTTIETVNQYLIQYLERAGASVWSVRERDMNPHEVIVDDEDPGFAMQGYWVKSRSTGYNQHYRYVYSSPTVTAAATYTPDIPESGWYWVSTHYRHAENRSQDVRYIVRHAGGETVLSINQEVHGMTWVYLGRFYFEKGRSGSVSITNQSDDPNQAIIADAVRFGGGKSVVPDEKGGLSQEPRYEEAAYYYTRFLGFPKGESDVLVRPQYADYELSKGTAEEQKSAVYISWHTNAGHGRGTGTETYVYSGSSRTKGSDLLQRYIHEEVVSDIRAEWDPNWTDRGQKKANFGELRELKTMPGTLIEVGFHDHPADAAALRHPKFRQLLARSVYQGITRYFAAQEGKTPIFLPEPPTHLSAVNIGNNSIKVSWRASQPTRSGGHPAVAYKVYVSTHGKAFGDGIMVYGEHYTFFNLKPGVTYYFKVTAINAGGESFDTPIVAARTPIASGLTTDFLIVDGFDRMDEKSAVSQYDGSYVGTAVRHIPDRMNTYDYAVHHAKALESANYSFDGATNEAVVDMEVALTKYPAVNWFTGEESVEDETLDAAERQLLATYLQMGGALMISGSEIGFHLARKDGGADPTFYTDYLKSVYVADDARTEKFVGSYAGSLSSIRGHINGNTSIYKVEYPDVLSPALGAKALLKYDGGTGGSAAIIYYGKDFKVIHFGFPLATIADEETRNQVIVQSAALLRKPPKVETTQAVVARVRQSDVTAFTAEPVAVTELPNPANITPNPFETHIVLGIADREDGFAQFTLRDENGDRVQVAKWYHRKGKNKYIRIQEHLPAKVYDYEVTIDTRTLRGKLKKR